MTRFVLEPPCDTPEWLEPYKNILNRIEYEDATGKAAARAYHIPICKDCSVELSMCRELARMRSHGVPLKMVADFIHDSRCDLCDKPMSLAHSGASHTRIDHDHSHCSATTGCSECVRGFLCHHCNTNLGGVESILKRTSIGKLIEYLSL